MFNLRRLAAVFLVSCGGLGASAQAMEGMSGMYNTCMVMAGMHEMHLSAYQPSTVEEFCADVPSTGPSIITINAVSKELLDMTMEVRIVRGDAAAVEAAGNLDKITLAYAPPKNYPTGIATLPVNFNEPGTYGVLVTVSDGKDMTMSTRFDLSVAKILSKNIIVWVAYSGMLIAVIGLFVWIEMRKKAKIKGADAKV